MHKIKYLLWKAMESKAKISMISKDIVHYVKLLCNYGNINTSIKKGRNYLE